MREGTDFLRGTFILISLFTIFSAPMFVYYMIWVTDEARIRQMTIGWSFLSKAQQDVLEANLIFSIISTACFTFSMYNPFMRADLFSPNCRKIASDIGRNVTSMAAAVILPVVQIIYNRVQWEEAKINESPIAIWIMTSLFVSGSLVIFVIGQVIKLLC